MEHIVWILGHGPVTIDKQFLLDIPRSKSVFTINGMPLPNNVFEAVRMLYDICHIQYFIYTKYMNQTMGNLMILYLQKIYPVETYTIVPYRNTYRVDAYYTESVRKIVGKMICRVLEDHPDILCVLNFDINKNIYNLSISLM